MRVHLGVDIGGTNIKLASVASGGEVIARAEIETRPDDGPEKAFARVKEALPDVVGNDEVGAAGIGCAGLIDPQTGRLNASPNLKAWEGSALQTIARDALGVYTIVENDATAAAYGEYRAGSNRDCHHLIFITLGTGVGGGIISDGRVIRGAAGYGGEVGHIAVNVEGPKCHCGSRGCIEAYAGTYGMVRMTRQLLAERKSRHLARWVWEERRKITPKLIMDAARRGDAVGKLVARRVGEYLGVAIASLVNVFNPEVVVIGGGVSESFDLLRPHIERTVARRAFDHSAEMVRFERSTLGNDATAVGAALMAMDRKS